MKTTPFHSPRGCLSYLVLDSISKEAAIIDPSEEIADEVYLSALVEHDATLCYVIETHTHADHISSASKIARETGARIVRHKSAPSPHKDIAVAGGERLPLGASELEIIATPGHTNESISIYADGAVFTGDTLLIGGTGRTDFQVGSSIALYDSLHTALVSLPDSTIVYPAHDYKGRTASTLGAERASNPRFLLQRDEFIETLDAHHPQKPELFDAAIAANSL